MSYYNQQQPPVGVPPPQGYPPEGYPKDAYPPPGYPPQGYPPQPYPAQGYPPPYAPQYAQPPPQQQSSSTGCLEGCFKNRVEFGLNCFIAIVQFLTFFALCWWFGCAVLLLSPGCMLLRRAWEGRVDLGGIEFESFIGLSK
ncbi:hypothetical protein HS088_TW17G00754 [Tripterygium wilfordii]|uniref:Cysteine-rich and transmembrane domain-containing protein A-like n=1 Tax=Tripterygium wilfordii TaxID=458696 RepID=A0A7J7CGP4_TRIWF|nr:hypothetical protein HS088_TW17G00754 [Tripterygium wilfordii]